MTLVKPHHVELICFDRAPRTRLLLCDVPAIATVADVQSLFARFGALCDVALSTVAGVRYAHVVRLFFQSVTLFFFQYQKTHSPTTNIQKK